MSKTPYLGPNNMAQLSYLNMLERLICFIK